MQEHGGCHKAGGETMARLPLPGWAAALAPVLRGTWGTLVVTNRARQSPLHFPSLADLGTSREKPGLREVQNLQESNGECVWESCAAVMAGKPNLYVQRGR